MMVVGKINGKIVEIVRYADKVGFSDVRGWICVCTDFEQMKRRQQHVKWVPATTMFEWVREFNFA